MTATEFENILVQGLNPSTIHEEHSLAEYISDLYQVYSKFHPTTFSVPFEESDKLSFLRRLKSIFQTTQGEARVLEEAHDDWFATAQRTHNYFQDYINHLHGRGYPPPLRAALSRDVRLITSLLANPGSPDLKSKRGLVVGHVQSGKTGNYIGVLSLAADYGYKVIVVLSGIQENLRDQTQMRIDEAFIGATWVDNGVQPRYVRVGVGERDHDRAQPHAATRKGSDFVTQHMSGISLSGSRAPIIFVCKKNVTVLDNLTSWVKTQQFGSNRVEASLLLIDDEADNAGINVGGKDSPTRINKAIRDLLDEFRISTYVGYTATPYANIFIEPPTDNDMANEDLFPRDFIVALSPPSNYIGAESLFSDTGDLKSNVRPVHDYMDVLPLKHKKNHTITKLPDSCKRALYSWYVACAIRYLRGHSSWHMTMMINASRFINIQRQIGDHIEAEVIVLNDALKAFGNLSESFDRNRTLRELHSIYEYEYPNQTIPWPEIVRAMVDFAATVCVRVINGDSRDVLNYELHKTNGLHVVAVGGLALSRGFTLEGLTTTYILRNAGAYDTLMQMGRWFGYRDDYADLTRVYMPEKSIEWYQFVCDATNELYKSFLYMSRQSRKPINFGLCVRHHSSTLSITARNKMRSAQVIETSISFANQLFETVYIDAAWNQSNLAEIERFIGKLHLPSYLNPNEPIGTVHQSEVAALLNAFNFPKANNPIFADRVYERLFSELRTAGIETWDVALYSGDGKQASIAGTTLRTQLRYCDSVNNLIRINGDKMRVASRGAEKIGLSPDERNQAKQIFDSQRDALEQSERKASHISDVYFRQVRKRPLLMVHLIEPRVNAFGLPDTLAALGLSIPQSEHLNSERARYAFNPRKQWEHENGFIHVEEDSEDDE